MITAKTDVLAGLVRFVPLTVEPRRRGRLRMLHVEHARMVDSAVVTRQVAAEITAERVRLAREARRLFAGGWTGAAASSFAAALAQWDEGAGHVVHALDRMGEAIGRADQGFRATDARDAGAVRSAGAALGSGLNL